MAQEICLDTDVSIAILKGEKRAEPILIAINDCKVSTTSISVFELMLRDYNLEQVKFFLNGMVIHNFDHDAAIKASEIQKQLKKEGKIVEFRDIFIASIAILKNCELLTFNEKDFKSIKGLTIFNNGTGH